MTLDRKDYKSAIPQLEGRLAEVEKIGKEAFNKFEDIAHKTQLDAAEAEKKALALDYKMTTTRVQMEYQLCTTGQTPVEANWQTTMPSITYNSYQGKTLWYRSKTYVNDIVVQKTEPMTVNLMDGVYAFVNTVSGNTGWTTIDGDTIQTGCITSHDGNCYFDIDNNNFQMKDNSTLASSTSALAWDNGQLYIKGKIAIGNTTTDKKYYTEMTGGGFDIVANDVNLAHIGYGSGASQSGGTSIAPYFILGTSRDNVHGNYSFTAGVYNKAAGGGTAAIGCGLVAGAAQNDITAGQVVIGRYNLSDSVGKYAFIVGNGTNEPAGESNALTVDWNGVARLAGNLFTGCSSDSTGGYEFGRKTGNHVVIGGIHVCWGQVSLTCSADAYTETTVTLPYTYSSAPYVFTGFAARNVNARSTMGTNGGLALNKIYVGCVSTSARDQTVVWMTIGA